MPPVIVPLPPAPSIPPIPAALDPDTVAKFAIMAHQNSGDDQDYLGAIIVIATLLICVALPVCLAFWYKARSARRLSKVDQAGVEDLWNTAQRMETRIGYLERVLDNEVPGWRSRSEIR